MPSTRTRQRLAAEVRRRIMEHGWAVQAIGSHCSIPGCGDADRREADFGYTAGLSRYDGHPELIVTGLHQMETVAPLNEMGQRVADGERFDAGHVVRLQAHPHTFSLLEVSPRQSARHLVYANELYRNPGMPPVAALQLVWPDVGDRYPWEAGYLFAPVVQPLLGPAPEC